MTTTRREFVRTSALAAAGLAVAPLALSRPFPGPRAGGKSLLILGGTGFIGPAMQEAAIARGYSVTLFNRGRAEDRRKNTGSASAVAEGVTILYGNRDPDKTADADNDGSKGEKKDPDSPKGLTQLEGKKFDAVIDTSGYFPRMVKASAQLLAPNVKQYLFISTVAVYKDTIKRGGDTTDALATIADPTVETFGSKSEFYGPLKVLCEKELLAAMPGRATIVRPGYILGRRDNTRRFTSWPVRASQGGEMIAPGSPEDPFMTIDVRDLAEWCVDLIDRRVIDTFDALGPLEGLAWGRALEACKAASTNDTRLTWIPGEFLEKQGVLDKMPLWTPATNEWAGVVQRNVEKSVKAGLKFRDIADTSKDALEWWKAQPAEMQPKLIRDFPLERENQVLAAWHKEGAPGK